MLIIETGTGDPAAEAYCDVAYADAYHSKRNRAAWSLLDQAGKEANLRLATDYMLQVYRNGWKGTRVTSHQVLDWPRYNVEIKDTGAGAFAYVLQPDVVPEEVKKANAELAFLIIEEEELNPTEGPFVIRQVLGPITTEYDPNSITKKKFPAVDGILSPLLNNVSGGASRRLVRS